VLHTALHDTVKTIEILVLELVCLRWSCKHFGRKKNLVKSLLISTLDEVIYYPGTFYRAQPNLSLLHNIGWRSAEKFVHFQHASSSVAHTISMDKSDPNFGCTVLYDTGAT
jgi:hypothetical protein